MLGSRHKPRYISPVPIIQDVGHVVANDLLSSLAGPPATRLAETTASNRHYTAGDLDVQRFVVPSGGPNSDVALDVAPLKSNHKRRLNKSRGEFPTP